MSKVVKKSLSLEKELAAKVEEMATMEHRRFSQLVSEAVSRLIDQWETSRLEEAYQQYYSRQRPTEQAQVQSYLRIARKTLPKHVDPAH